MLGRLDARSWLLRGRCWYNLTGLEPDSDGSVRCPECGCTTRAEKLLCDGRRCRLELVSLVTLLLAGSAFVVPWILDGTWAGAMPTPILVVVERIDAGRGVEDVRHEVDQRVAKGKVTGWSASLLAEALAEDLVSDEVHWNAERAEDLLRSLWPDSQSALENALHSRDMQAQLLAARLLRKLCTDPSDSLLSACVQDLRDDSRSSFGWYLTRHNAAEASDYLVRWAPRAEPMLAEALHSLDRQQRLLAAAVAGYAGLTDLIAVAAPILIEHLRDNSIPDDAKVAAPSLFRFGPEVLPYLREHVDSNDRQLGPIVRAIVERLEYPDRPLHRLGNPMPWISVRTNNPLQHLRLGDSTRGLRWKHP